MFDELTKTSTGKMQENIEEPVDRSPQNSGKLGRKPAEKY